QYDWQGRKRASKRMPFASSVPTGSSIAAVMVATVVMMVMMVMTMRARPDADIYTGAVMVVMMMVADYNLSSPCTAAWCQALIIGFQQRQGVRDWIEKVPITVGLRQFRPARRRRLGCSHLCSRSQQTG